MQPRKKEHKWLFYKLRNLTVFAVLLKDLPKMDGFSTDHLQGVHMKDNPNVEDLLNLSILLYDFNVVDGKNIEKLARQSVQKKDSATAEIQQPHMLREQH